MTVWQSISDIFQGITENLGQVLDGFTGRSTPPEKSVAFTIGMIALSAKMARADGIVTDNEVHAFTQVFRVAEKDKAAVERVFNMAKQDIAGFENYAAQVAKLFGPKSSVLENVLDGLFHIAKADGVIHEKELSYLQSVAEIFGFNDTDWRHIQARHVAVRDNPYYVLGVETDARMVDIKKHYKSLVRQLHPDMQIAAGVPAEMVKLASDRLAKINAAYAEIEKVHEL